MDGAIEMKYLTWRVRKWPKDKVRQFRWNRQRINRGFSDLDWWNLNDFVAEVVAEGCKKLRENGNGYPIDLDVETWHDILKKIEKGFRAYLALNDLGYDSKEEAEELEKKFKEGGDLFIHWFGGLWD